jgi:hypothetical protein
MISRELSQSSHKLHIYSELFQAYDANLEVLSTALDL